MYTMVIGTGAPVQEENSRTEGDGLSPLQIVNSKTVFKL